LQGEEREQRRAGLIESGPVVGIDEAQQCLQNARYDEHQRNRPRVVTQLLQYPPDGGKRARGGSSLLDQPDERFVEVVGPGSSGELVRTEVSLIVPRTPAWTPAIHLIRPEHHAAPALDVSTP
jgi:hypothetical protein